MMLKYSLIDLSLEVLERSWNTRNLAAKPGSEELYEADECENM